MGALRIVGNVLWFLPGGLVGGLVWCIAGLVCAITIIGIPWSRACFRIGLYTFFPFGKDVISQTDLTGAPTGFKGALQFIGNLIWFFVFGLILLVIHVTLAVAYFFTILGIPFGYAHIKLAAASVFPLGKRVVDIEVANLARAENAKAKVQKLRVQ